MSYEYVAVLGEAYIAGVVNALADNRCSADIRIAIEAQISELTRLLENTREPFSPYALVRKKVIG